MDPLLSLIGIGVVAFASTNIDDFVMLIALFTDRAYRPVHIVVGQFIGMVGLIALSLLGSLLALVVPTAYIGFIGVVPIAIGIRRLFLSSNALGEFEMKAGGVSSVTAATLITLANGGDNLSLYIPLFAAHRGEEIGAIIAVFLILTAVWCVAGYALARPQFEGRQARRWGDAVLPYVMIGLGLYIFAKTDVLAVFGG
jgi:cadmium resistance protein CadD (predicted permease)